jgi:hypothetical protein
MATPSRSTFRLLGSGPTYGHKIVKCQILKVDASHSEPVSSSN